MTRRSGPRDGFTLIETLVALTVVALVSVALQRGFVAARLALARAESLFAGETVARSILETRLDELAPGPGVRRGTTDGLAWTVTSDPLDLPFASAAPRPAAAGVAGPAAADGPKPARPKAVWVPLRVTIEVAAGDGPKLVVETIHLGKAS